jgi:hypothetical protein
MDSPSLLLPAEYRMPRIIDKETRFLTFFQYFHQVNLYKPSIHSSHVAYFRGIPFTKSVGFCQNCGDLETEHHFHVI